MPTYLSHDFYFNFINSYNSDKELTRDIMADELAKVIVFQPDAVKKALVKFGMTFKEGASEKDLTDIVYKNKDNQKLKDEILLIITRNHPLNIQSLFPNTANKTKVQSALNELKFSLGNSFDFTEKQLSQKVEIHLHHKKLFNTRTINPNHLVLTGMLISIVLIGSGALIYKVLNRNGILGKPKMGNGGQVQYQQSPPTQQQGQPQPQPQTSQNKVEVNPQQVSAEPKLITE